MGRGLAGIVAGFVIWIAVATAGNLLLRVSWPSYAAAEVPMQFTLSMMVARLLLGALSSMAAGYVITLITGRVGTAVKIFGVVLTLMFIPVHYQLWSKFPVWYHLVFLGSLMPLTLAGAMLPARGSSSARRSADVR